MWHVHGTGDLRHKFDTALRMDGHLIRALAHRPCKMLWHMGSGPVWALSLSLCSLMPKVASSLGQAPVTARQQSGLRIMALGDSITYGWWVSGQHENS